MGRLRYHYAVPAAYQYGFYQPPDNLFVFADEDGLRAGRHGGPSLRVDRLLQRVDTGQKHLKGTALSGLAIDDDLAVVLFHDPVDDREAEAGPLPRLLGGEERLEEAA